MNQDLRDRFFSLITAGISNEELLREGGVSDGVEWGARLLGESTKSRDGLGVEIALHVCYTFGFSMSGEQLDHLIELSSADWHHAHENVVMAIGYFVSPRAVEALYAATQWVPEYLEFDDARALAVKAIWALGAIPDDNAMAALHRLLESDVEVLRENAAHQIARRTSGPSH